MSSLCRGWIRVVRVLWELTHRMSGILWLLVLLMRLDECLRLLGVAMLRGWVGLWMLRVGLMRL